jgi:hypothetical protein
MYIRAKATFSNTEELKHLPQAVLNEGHTTEVDDEYGMELIRAGLAEEVDAPVAEEDEDGEAAAQTESAGDETESTDEGGAPDTDETEASDERSLKALDVPFADTLEEQAGLTTVGDLKGFLEEHPEEGVEAVTGIGSSRAESVRVALESLFS